SLSQRNDPSVLTIFMGSKASCADHEWKTCLRSSSYARWASFRMVSVNSEVFAKLIDFPYSFCGKPRLMPPWDGSSHRVVTALPRVKNCTPSVPWAWVSPNSEFFQPPKE